MDFNELKLVLEKKYGVTKLADIARELDVSPQTVNNWKIRNQVPYKYVKMVRERSMKPDFSENYINPFAAFSSSNDDNSDGNSVEEILSFIRLSIKILKREYVSVIFFPILSLFIGIMILKVVDPVYMTKAKILPLSSRTDNSGARGIAAQFGINLGGMKSDDMYTAEMYPEILKSRSFLKRLLLLKFKTKDLGEKKLVSVIHKKDIKKSSKNFDGALSSGINKLLKNNLTIKKTKMSPVIEIIVKTNEPGLSKSIGDSILSQLSLAVNEYKLKKVNDRISFIKSRLFNVKQELNQTEENLNNFRKRIE